MASRRSSPLRLGFIGGGLNSAIGLTHRLACEMDRRFKLEAGSFSGEPGINHETAAAWGVDPDRVYGDWRRLLEEHPERLDAVVVLTPIPSHAEIVLHALQEGSPVICEKALTDSSASARKVKQAVEQQGGFLAVIYNYSGYPMLRELRMMIRQGRLGKVTQLLAEMPQEGFIRLDREGRKATPQAWRLRDGETVPTVSLDLGAHLHQIIHFLTGARPLEVVAVHDTFGRFPEVVDNALAMARYTEGLRCSLWYGKASLGHRNGLRVRVYGTDGSAEWYQMDPEVLRFCDVHGVQTDLDRTNNFSGLPGEPRYNRFKAGHPAGFIEAFANYYSDLAEALLRYRAQGASQEESQWVFGAEVAEEGLRMLEAVALSSRTGAWERV